MKIAGYPVQEMGGLIWAYLGPQPAPLLPRWEPLVAENAVRDICFTNLACNWLQCQENSLDPVHVEWMHRYFGDWVNSQKYGNFDISGGIGNVRHHVKIGFDEFEYGIIKRRVLEGYTEEDDDWKHGHPVPFPNILVVGNDYQVTMQFRVPVDDENTLHISVYTWMAAPGKTSRSRQPLLIVTSRLWTSRASGSGTRCSTRTTWPGRRRGRLPNAISSAWAPQTWV